jgi:hypothetical protein
VSRQNMEAKVREELQKYNEKTSALGADDE